MLSSLCGHCLPSCQAPGLLVSFIAPNDNKPYISCTHIYTQVTNNGERNDVYTRVYTVRVTGGPVVVVVIFLKEKKNEISAKRIIQLLMCHTLLCQQSCFGTVVRRSPSVKRASSREACVKLINARFCEKVEIYVPYLESGFPFQQFSNLFGYR